jgi:hypothetical protein
MYVCFLIKPVEICPRVLNGCFHGFVEFSGKRHGKSFRGDFDASGIVKLPSVVVTISG